MNFPLLSAFWADIDMTYGPGNIYFHEYTRITDNEELEPLIGAEQEVFDMATEDIQEVETYCGNMGFEIFLYRLAQPKPYISIWRDL